MSAQSKPRDLQEGMLVQRQVSHYFGEDSEFLFLVEPLLTALGWRGYFRHLTEALPHFTKALDITNFRAVMAKLGFKSELLNYHIEDIRDEFLPCVFIPENMPAMVIVKRVDEHLHEVFGEAHTYENISLKGLDGKIFIFYKDDKTTNILNREYGWVAGMFNKFKMLFVQVLIISTLMNLFLIAFPLFFMGIFDRVVGIQSDDMLYNFMIGTMIVLMGAYVMHLLRSKIVAFIAARCTKNISFVIMQRLFYLSPSHTESASPSHQIAKVLDFDSVTDYLSSPLVASAFDLPFFLLYLIAIAFIGDVLVFIPVVFLFLMIATWYFTKVSVHSSVVANDMTESSKESFQVESMASVRLIKACQIEDIWLKRYEHLSANAFSAGFKITFVAHIFRIISDLSVKLASICIVYFGALMVMNGNLSLGGLFCCLMLTWRALYPWKTYLGIMPTLTSLHFVAKQINNFMKIELERDPDTYQKPMTETKGEVNFQRVSFRYRADMAPSLLGVTFAVKSKELVCIAGKNGAGKSTILKMLLKMYTPQAGSVSIDHSNLLQLDPIELRQTIAYMPQTPKFFFGTIEQNLLFANSVASRSELEVAARLAGIYEEIMNLPLGFSTNLGDLSESGFSAGFQQKLALARAYLRRAPIMLLDEPTSSLDMKAEELFMKTLTLFRHQRTIFLVTHRPSHLKIADRILYIQQGQLIMNGTPEEVLPKLPIDLL